ncbi:unnamed protein product [Somion occarium]|uniref:Mediator of RNA polymerase II transcription subunit 6 n=1 Tax=Somion occarium TaxID=3059160 RepID=A0ABP1CNP4_9APHY
MRPKNLGIEFALVHSQPPSMFIIHKRERFSPDEFRPLAAYFIINNRIYQSPDVYSLISNRLLTSLHSLQTSLDTLRSHRPAYTPRTGFVWPVMEASASEDASKRGTDGELQKPEDPQSIVPKREKITVSDAARKRQQNNMLLWNAIRSTAVHATQSFTLPSSISEQTAPETPTAGTGTPSAATPAPIPARAATPKTASNAPTPGQEVPPPKGPTGGGKKKKKRTSIAPPTG